MGKVQTPAWILEGYDSPEEYNKKQSDDSSIKRIKKEHKVRKCPKCGSFDVVVVTGEDAKGLWRCGKCAWKGQDVAWEEMDDEEFMKYIDSKEEDVA